jgi:hypothetical protein
LGLKPRNLLGQESLLQGRIAGGSGVAGGAGLVVVDDAVLAGAERALAGDADGNGLDEDGVSGDEAGGVGGAGGVGDGIAALGAGDEDLVDGGDGGAAAIAWTEVGERDSETFCGALHKILDVGGGKGADGADRGRLVGGDAGLEQVGNGDAGDDENDGDDDEQLNERKAVLRLHRTFLRVAAEAMQRRERKASS